MLEPLVENYYNSLQNKSETEEFVENSDQDPLYLIRLYACKNGAECKIWEKKVREEQNLESEDQLSDSVRGRVWKLLLGVQNLDAESYVHVLEAGRMAFCYSDIRLDTPRTFGGVSLYRNRVPEKILVRLLNYYCQADDCAGYVQGMNGIAGAMLVVMPELEAYHCFHRVVHDLCPTYWNKEYNIVGAYAGAFLVHDCLKVCDSELYSKLELVHPWTYAFPAVTSLYTVAPPLEELLKLWDFLFAFGIHLNILCVAAQLINERDVVFESDLEGRRSSRKWPPINARSIINTVLEILPVVKQDLELWSNIQNHTTDYGLAGRIKEMGSRKILLKSNRTHKRFESKPIVQPPDP